MLQLLEGRHESKTLVEQTANYLHMGNTWCIYSYCTCDVWVSEDEYLVVVRL